MLFCKIKARLYTAPTPSSQSLTPPLPLTLNSPPRNFHWVISRHIQPQILLWEFPHLSARVETPASVWPSLSRSSGSDGRTVLHVGPCCFQQLFLYLGVKQTTKKPTIATANPAPLGHVLPSVAFFPLALWSCYLQTLARDLRALSRPGTQLRDFRRQASSSPSAPPIHSPTFLSSAAAWEPEIPPRTLSPSTWWSDLWTTSSSLARNSSASWDL